MNDVEASTESDMIQEHQVKTDNPNEAIGRDASPTALGQLDLQMWEAPGPGCHMCLGFCRRTDQVGWAPSALVAVWLLCLAVSVLGLCYYLRRRN